MAAITMELVEYTALQTKQTFSDSEVVRLQKELVDAKLGAGDGKTTRALTELSRALLTITRFAVGALAPEVTKHWPTEALKKAADLLAMLPDHTVDDISIQVEFRAFAVECERFDRWRASNAVEITRADLPPLQPVRDADDIRI